MLCYLVYDEDYRLYQVFEHKPEWSKIMRWHAEGWHEVICARDVPADTQKVLAKVGMLQVVVSVYVLFHTEHDCSLIGKEDEPCS